jgi:hypothetical protein
LDEALELCEEATAEDKDVRDVELELHGEKAAVCLAARVSDFRRLRSYGVVMVVDAELQRGAPAPRISDGAAEKGR